MSRRQRNKRRRHQRGGGGRRAAFLAFGVAFVGVVIGALSIVGYIVGIASTAPNIDSLKPADKGSASVVYAADGRRLGFISSDTLRTPVSTDEMPLNVRRATVAIEDQRYYKHKGVDYEGIIRAAVKNLKSGKAVQGGSTITMQLVRNNYIAEKRTFKRKIREAKLAEELENRESKRDILTDYLNSVPYGTVGGQTAVGIQAASRVFFNKSAKDLTLPEAAMLAGLPQAPSEYNPFRDPDAARARRDEVIHKMAKLGMITQTAATQAAHTPLRVHPNAYYTARRESYFFDYVQDELIRRYGVNEVRKGGLKVYTTIKPKFQAAARNAIKTQLGQPDDPSSAIVTIDPANGQILAMASSGSYKNRKFNLAAQGHRQAGSTFKVMVLMTALRQGVDPDTTTYVSKPLNIDDPTYGKWQVTTYGGDYGGVTNLVSATLKSDNTVYAQLDLDVGPQNVKKTAEDMGITTPLQGYPAEGLGGLKYGVSALELANAYATIADGGWRNTPTAIKRVVFPSGKVDDIGKGKRVKKFSDGVTYEATKILKENMQGGTATRAQIGCPAAAKTGTVDDFTDAWLAGFTPKLATAVWVGYPNKKVPMTSVHGIAVNGGSFPAQIWGQYMNVAKGNFCGDFPPPKDPIVYKPFFGKYSRTGSASDNNYSYGTNGYSSGQTGTGQPQTGGTPGYNPKFYESPPQQAPKIVTPQTPATQPQNSPAPTQPATPGTTVAPGTGGTGQ
jgi:penicillin-binding protein 1A